SVPKRDLEMECCNSLCEKNLRKGVVGRGARKMAAGNRVTGNMAGEQSGDYRQLFCEPEIAPCTFSVWLPPRERLPAYREKLSKDTLLRERSPTSPGPLIALSVA